MSSRSYVPDLCDVVHLHPARVAELREALIGEHEVIDLAETFRALGDPTRVRILDALAHGELCVCDLAAVVRMSESAVSHQLRLLRNLRLVKPRRDGRMVFYSLDDRHIITLFRQGLRHVQEERTHIGRVKPRPSGGRAR
jgi:ArsR family transcriptional regulator, lead/cadmium/zinc/bismuth-responsive transcriptional repressor